MNPIELAHGQRLGLTLGAWIIQWSEELLARELVFGEAERFASAHRAALRSSLSCAMGYARPFPALTFRRIVLMNLDSTDFGQAIAPFKTELQRMARMVATAADRGTMTALAGIGVLSFIEQEMHTMIATTLGAARLELERAIAAQGGTHGE